MITAQNDIVIAIRRFRDERSESDDIGIAPSTNRTPVAPPIAPSTASETSSDFWMSGARTLKTPPSITWSAPSSPRIVIVRDTAEAQRFAQRHRVLADARQFGVGEEHLGHHRGFGATDLGLEHRRRERGGIVGSGITRAGVSHGSLLRRG